MYFINKGTLLFFLIIFSFLGVKGQAYSDARIQQLSLKLDSLAKSIPHLNDTSRTSFIDVSLSEFTRTLSKAHQLNVYIDNDRKELISNAFYGEKVKNILLFLCWKYKLSIESVGTILHLVPYNETPKPPLLPPIKDPIITMKDSLLSFDLKADTLTKVVKKIAQLSGKTIVNLSKTEGFLSGYLAPNPIDDAIQNLFLMNGYEVSKSDKGVFYVQQAAPTTPNAKNNTGVSNFAATNKNIAVKNGKIQLNVNNENLEEILKELLNKTQNDYIFLDKIEGTITASIEGDSLNVILSQLMRGTKYTFKFDNSTYLVGEKVREGFRDYRIVKIKYRPSTKIIELIPAAFKEGVLLTEYVGLNRIVLFGPEEKLVAVEDFIKEVDRPIPMVRLEMMVLDVNVSRIINTSLKAGLLQPGDSLSGGKSILPGFEYTVDGKGANQLLSLSGVPFLQGIGSLKSNFYLQIKALEELGNVEVLTRPIISALNGEEASFTIGETQYFRLLTNTTANGINPITQTTEQLQQFQYNTTLTIKPFISEDDMLTLEVHPNFTSPGAQVDAKTPPALLKREFNSTIRIKNGESFILGGLSKDILGTSTKGLPLLARIPVIKWLTGTNQRQKTKTTLLIYITPTIIYN